MKLKRIWLLLAIGVIAVGAMAGILGNKEDTVIEKLRRPNYSNKSTSHVLTAKVADEEYEVEVLVEPMKISADKLQSCFDEAFETVCKKMCGNNPSLTDVREDLVFVEEIEEYGIGVNYFVDDYSVINSFGEVQRKNIPKEGKSCEITINLEYEEMVQSYKVPVMVFPEELSEKEQFIEELEESINEKNAVAGEEFLTLPKEVGGKEVTFVEKPESKLPIIVVFVLIALVAWYYKTFVIKRNEAKAREEELQMDYSELVSKISLLMGAGMSGVNALNKIAIDYKDRLGKKEKKRVAYEEIVATVNRISTGVSEADAYVMFGRECKSHCYIKLGSLLAQNIRKGGEGFMAALKAEVSEAFLERKARARRAGEEAGTKLLLPMGMMLCVVLVVIVVPAFMSF